MPARFGRPAAGVRIEFPDEEVGVGRHTAADDEPMHPVVAAALARRASDPAGIHRGDPSRDEGALGWPGEPAPSGGGLGWPGDLEPERPAADTGEYDPEVEDPAPGLDETGRRRGWRRLLGARAA
jgi:hypothetical protein